MPAKHRFVRLGAALVLLAAAILSLFVTRAGPSAPTAANLGDTPMMAAPAGMPPASAEDDAADPEALRAGQSLFNDTSPALRDIKPIPAEAWTTPRQMPEVDPLGTDKLQREVKDSVLQSTFGALDGPMAMPAPSRNFAGLTNVNGVYPPDTTGEAGPNHYMQWVNLSFAIYDKATGARVYGPANGNTIWAGFGGACDSQNSGDPIVLYDQGAGRWVVSQFTSSSPYGECVAVSTTSDPTGSWHRYFFQHSTSVFYDYPHMGVWPDGYYTTFNKFRCRGVCTYQGAAVVVYDRAKMLLGQPAGFQEKGLSSSYGYPLPSDWDGNAAPPAGTPNFLVARSSTTGLNLWKFSVNWSNSAASALTGPTTLSVAAYNQLCPAPRRRLTASATARCSALPTATWAPTRPSLPTTRSTWTAAARFVRACAGTRYATPTAPPLSTSRAPTPPPTGSTAGWVASRWTTTAISPSATRCRAAASTPPSATPVAWRPTLWASSRRVR
jgi:hypothetical protein